jgi:cell volume regulation protein A
VNVIVRGGEAIPPRGSTEIAAEDELHILVRAAVRSQVEELIRTWQEGPIDEPPRPALAPRASPQIFHSRPWTDADGDEGRPDSIGDLEISERLRTRRDAPGALMVLADGRYACTGDGVVAIGSRTQIADWAAGRIARTESSAAKAWWQEVAGVLNAPAR